MARPTKKGLDYFPLDTAMNDKLKLIEAEYGSKGFAVIIKLFMKIYGEKGYYCDWNPEVVFMFTREHCPDVGVSTVSEIVSSAIRRGIFNQEIYDKFKVLTSKGIQERYLEATKRRNFQKIEDGFLLACGAKNIINVDNNPVNVDNNSENNNNKYINKSKVNNSSCSSNTDNSVYKFYSENINPLPSITEIEEMKYWLDEVGIEEDMFIEAIKTALMNNKRNMKYIVGILKNKVKQGIKTKQDYLNDEKIKGEIKNDGAKHNRSVEKQQKSDRGSDEPQKQFPKSFGLYI
ncbi:MAG: DUF4373 domain-containing protein [bacterium]|nr:DUF4373 domain-containing protein [bacterium]